MKWSNRQQRMAKQVQAIQEARHAAAEAELAAANASLTLAQDAQSAAERDLRKVEADWNTSLKARGLDPDLDPMFASALLLSDTELRASERRLVDASANAERKRVTWQSLEASVRAGDQTLRAGRRRLAKRADERRNQELSDRTSWNRLGS